MLLYFPEVLLPSHHDHAAVFLTPKQEKLKTKWEKKNAPH